MKNEVITSLIMALLVVSLSATAIAAEPTISDIASDNGITLGGETGLETLPVIPGRTYSVVLIAEYAGMKDGTTGGWYAAGDPSSKQQFFSGPDSPVVNASFTVPDGVYAIGFYINPDWYPGTTWYSEKSLNIDNTDHVQIYPIEGEGPQAYLVGFEDLRYGGDQDYNDHVFIFGPPAPEFAFVAMPVVIMGLVLGFSYRSAKKKFD